MGTSVSTRSGVSTPGIPAWRAMAGAPNPRPSVMASPVSTTSRNAVPTARTARASSPASHASATSRLTAMSMPKRVTAELNSTIVFDQM